MSSPRSRLNGETISLDSTGFDLALTLRSGQVFRWTELGEGSFGGWLDGSFARVSQRQDRLQIHGATEARARDFFALDVDLPELSREIGVDPVIREALERYPGLRVVRQDPWECAASFMLSAYNNIPRLTGMLERLSALFAPSGSRVRSRSGRAYGCASTSSLRSALKAHSPSPRTGLSRDPRPARGWGERALTDEAVPPSGGRGAAERAGWDRGPSSIDPGPPRTPTLLSRGGSASESPPRVGRRGKAAPASQAGKNPFPKPEVLAEVPERVLRNCGLGYRAPYLRAMAREVASGRVELEKLRVMDDEELRRALLGLPGIGEKVVECVMLFAYGRGAAFPVDVWIGRAMREWYFRRRKVSDKKIREFALKHFGPRCGWAQQYLYCLARWRSRDS